MPAKAKEQTETQITIHPEVDDPIEEILKRALGIDSKWEAEKQRIVAEAMKPQPRMEHEPRIQTYATTDPIMRMSDVKPLVDALYRQAIIILELRLELEMLKGGSDDESKKTNSH